MIFFYVMGKYVGLLDRFPITVTLAIIAITALIIIRIIFGKGIASALTIILFAPLIWYAILLFLQAVSAVALLHVLFRVLLVATDITILVFTILGVARLIQK